MKFDSDGLTEVHLPPIMNPPEFITGGLPTFCEAAAGKDNFDADTDVQNLR